MRLWTSIKLLLCLALVGVGLCCSVAFGDAPLPPVVSGSALDAAPGASGGLLLGAQSAEESEQARLANPEAVAERERSRTEYEGLKGPAAVSLAERVFDVERPAWTAPGSQEGAHITKYLGGQSAEETLPGGERALVQSSVPLRSGVGSGQLAPVSLALEEHGGSFVPANPLVPVSISRSAAGGMSFPLGVSVAPSQAAGGEGAEVVGDSVIYPGTARDTDFLVEPLPEGVETSWQLLSQASSQENALVFRLPEGASLKMSSTTLGGAEVVDGGQTLLAIPPAGATEANGVTLPVSYTVSGSTLTTHVDLSGSVDFPVMVDPLIVGYYGSSENVNVWPNWATGSNCSCFSFPEYGNLIQAGTNPGPPNGDSGEWYIYAPGAGTEGGASIERVDIMGMTHESGNQSYIETGIGESTGSNPVYSFNGTIGASGPSPLDTAEAYSNIDMAFCAQGAGGHDGGEQPLCNENYGGRYFQLADILGPEPRTVYNYVQMTGANVTYLDTTPPVSVHIGGLAQTEWVKYGPSATAIYGHDQGTGIAAFSVEIPPGHLNEKGQPFYSQNFSCDSSGGFAGCPMENTSGVINFSELATGAYSLGVYAYDAVGNVREAEVGPAGEEDKGSGKTPKLYIDHTPPKLTLTGALKEANGGHIGEGSYPLNITAEDGSTAAPQSGIQAIKIYADGRWVEEAHTTCHRPEGIPATECYSLSASWTMQGERFGVGTHTVKVVAEDWEGNEASETIQVTVNSAAYQPLGPGAVNLKTGDYKLTATDVSVAAVGGTLSVARSYDSREHSRGTGGPLGADWTLSLPDAPAGGLWQSLRALPGGSVQVGAASGVQVTFASNGKEGFISPPGYQTLTLSEPSKSPLEFRMTNAAGDATIFTRANSKEEEAPLLVPTGVVQASGVGNLNKTTYKYTTTNEGITEPTLALAPEPAGSSCLSQSEKHEELGAGCRALEFAYATETNAGEGESEWKEYKGRLKEVLLVAYNPSSKAMAKTPVAKYLYDNQGELREEWNPQISPALKTIYGYGNEGRVTAITPPGQEPWLFTYGTIASDYSPDRLVKAMRAPEAAPLWAGKLLESTGAPTITGSPLVGTRMTVSTGAWSGSPLTYSFQWEDCNSEGKECSTVLGATNANYTPVSSDVGHRLMVYVTATNSGGTAAALSLASNEVKQTEKGESALPSGSKPVRITTGPDGNLWFTEEGSSKVASITPRGVITEHALPVNSLPWGIATGSDKNLWFCEDGTHKIGKITTAGVITEYTLPAGSEPLGMAAGPDKNLWFVEYGTSKIGKITTSGTVTEYSLPAGSKPYDITAGPDGNLWFTDASTSKVGKITTGGTITEYSLPAGSSPHAITTGSDGNLWVAEFATNKVAKVTTSGAVTEYSLAAGSEPYGITGGADKDLWVTAIGVNKVDRVTTSGAVTAYSLPSGSEPAGITSGPDANVWFDEFGTSEIGRLLPSPAPGEAQSPQPGSTIEYGVPLSGTGLPNLTKSEVEKWGQKDVPAEASATAILPPDKPMGWPASKYERASIFYLDSSSRTVNVESPAGGIATVEYSSQNNMTRTLSADDRAKALGESKPAEAAEHLSTVDTYNEGSEPGTELTSTLGPEHKVKLPGGSEVQARKQVTYTYNDAGAPSEGGPYRLPTQTTEAALVEGKEEDKRTTADSYSGQEGEGWKLHMPTSTTVAPESLKLTRSTTYSTTTGAQLESTTPAAGGKEMNVPPVYSSVFGVEGEGAGQFRSPEGDAIDSSGNIWVLDEGNNRLQEFSSAGTFIKTVGFGVSNGKAEFQTCTSSCRAGIAGSGNGQFNAPVALSINQSTGNMYVSDFGNNRVEELNSKGEYVRVWGKEGTEHGQFKGPIGVTVDSSGNVWVADSLNNRVQQFTSEGVFKAAYGTLGSGNGQFKSPGAIAFSAGNMYVVDEGNNRVEELTTSGGYVGQFASKGSGNGQLLTPTGIATDPGSGSLLVLDWGNNRVEMFSAAGYYLGQFGSKGSATGQFNGPQGLVFTPAGEAYIADTTNERVQKWIPPTAGNNGAHTSQSIYYSAKTEAGVPACENHPEWASLLCQTQAVHQPEIPAMPELAVTTYTYNMWDEPETTTSTSATTTRTESDTYDAGGRLKSKEIKSSSGTTLPKVTYEYSTTTGALIKQSTGSGESEKKITSTYTTRGELATYTDAEGTLSTYKYEEEGRPTQINDGKGTQTYTYNETTGLPQEITDSSNEAMKFTATYDPEGNILTETYPNGMTATTTYNPVGEATGIEYKKTTHCTENCTWFTDSVVPAIHGQWASQTSTLSKEAYSYDEAGRLVKTEETPAGKHCKTRLYSYDEDGNRLAFAKNESTTETCTTEGLSEEKHGYDTADRLLDSGVEYNPFGDITTLPAADAGGEKLTSRYYTDGQLAEQEQAGETIGYTLDPGRRTLETISTGRASSTVANHYAGEGASPAWTSELGGKWTRYIEGYRGLDAIQTDGEEPILEISNLRGDIIETASMSQTATKPLTSADTTEYGVPTNGTPARYSWLGTKEIPTELPSGVTAMGARSYVPEIGRFLQPDPQPGGSANSYAYTYGDPLNQTDTTGQWTLNETSGGTTAVGSGEGQKLAGGTGIAAGAIMPQPVNAQIEAEFQANPPWDQATAGTEEYEEYWEEEEWEEGGYEYASYHHDGRASNEEAHLEEGILYHLEGEGAVTGQHLNSLANLATLCAAEKTETLGSGCMRYVGLFGEIVSGIEKVAKGGVRVIKHAASSVWHWVKKHAGLVKTVDCNISGGGAGVLTGVGASAFTDNLYVGGSLGAAVAAGVTYACEHQSGL